MRQENDLGKDPIGRLVVRIALPSMLAQLVNVYTTLLTVCTLEISLRREILRWRASAYAGLSSQWLDRQRH